MSHLERAMAGIRRHLLPFVFVLYVVAYLDRVNVSFAAAGVSKDLGLTSASYGFAAGIFFLGYVLFEVPSNLILNRVGARKWISRILVSWGVVAALMAFITTAEQLYGLRFVLGVAEAGFFPGIVLFLSQWVPAAQRARTMAGFMLAIPVAGLLGGPISAVLLSLHGLGGLEGWRWLFLFEALPAIVLGIVVWQRLPNRPREARWLDPADAEALEDHLETERRASQDSHQQVHGLAAAFTEPRLWLLAVVYIGVATGFYGFSFWIPRFVGEALSTANPSPALVNLISAIPYGLAVLAMLLVGRSADRQQEYRLHVAVPLAVAAASLALAIGSDGLLRLLLISVATAAAFSCLGPFWAIPPQFLGGRGAAGGIATINSVGNIGGFMAPFGMGRLLLLPNGDALALGCLAAVLLISAVVALALQQTKGRKLIDIAP
jgi:ACS family tartrate transporter-like MFS transporter